MKLTSIELWPDGQNNYLPMDFNDPRGESHFFIKNATGLDADEISAQFYGAGSKNYRNLKVAKRTVVLKLGLRPNFKNGDTFGTLRDFVYSLVASTRTGQTQLRFLNEVDEIAQLSGYISKIESPQFEQKQELSISIECINPMLASVFVSAVSITGVDLSGFIANDTKSTAPHGCTMWFQVIGSTPSITIKDPIVDTSWFFKTRYLSGFTNNDIVAINSDPNNRQISLFRGSNVYNIADSIQPGSVWPIMFPGENIFAVEEATKVSIFDFNFFATYWGV
jgi:hypothetical protein